MSQQHWEKIYENKTPDQMSWTQDEYTSSLQLLQSINADKNSKIIDVGGGDGNFVKRLLELGYQDITVLNISKTAIENAKKNLGEDASKIKWIVSDIKQFQPTETYDIWHDRATFHFLTTEKDIQTYINLLKNNLKGNLIIGTFSTNGPLKCSGLDITQYSENSMQHLLKNDFEKVECFTEDHTTPFDSTQNFLFCNFKKINS